MARELVVALMLLGSLTGIPPAAAAGPGSPAYGMRVVSAAGMPAKATGGETLTVAITLENTGSVAWDPARNFFLSYHWLSPDGKVLVWDGRRSRLPHPVQPGGRVTVRARVEVPRRVGRMALQWDVVEEHVYWISRRTVHPPKPVPVLVEAVRPGHAFSVLSASIPRLWTAGGVRRVRLTLRNDGTVTWRPDRPFNVAYHWLSGRGRVLVFEGRRTRIPRVVPPGGRVAVTVTVQAPRRMGRALLQVDMVHEGVCWFSQQDLTPEPATAVLVVPRLWGYPALPLIAVVLLLVAALLGRRRMRSDAARSILALADLAWFLVALAAKQRAVLDAAGMLPAPGSAWVAMSGVALFGLVLAALPARVRPWVTWALSAALSFVILADVVYVRYFGDVLSLEALGAGHQVGDLGESIAALLHWRDLWLAADLLPGLFLAWIVSRPGMRPRRWQRAVAAVLLAAALIPGLGAAWRAGHARSGLLVQVFDQLFVVREVGVINTHLVDLWSQLHTRVLRRPLSRRQREEVVSWFADRAPVRRGGGRFFGAAEGMNLLMIQVESMQGFVVGLRIGGRKVTPNLDRWLSGCAWFPHCVDQTGQGRTSDGEITTQVSLLPRPRGALVFAYPNNHYVGLAGLLRARGYHTLSAVAFQPNFWNRSIMHPAFGYAENLFAADFAPGEKIGWGLNDRDFLLQMEARLAQLQQPFCAWLITLSLHYPFEGFPDHLKELDVGRWRGTPFGEYLHAMHFFDRALGDMVNRMARDGLLDNTVIVLWGDHDAGFSWTPELARAVGRRYTEADWYLFGRVPLIIRIPGSRGPRGTFPAVAGHTDVAPTVAALMGVDPAGVAWVGRNLFGTPGHAPVPLRYGSWISDRHVYANHGPGWADGACYDLETLRRLPVQACREEDAAARREAEVSDLVERYDLQRRVTAVLGGAGSGPR